MYFCLQWLLWGSKEIQRHLSWCRAAWPVCVLHTFYHYFCCFPSPNSSNYLLCYYPILWFYSSFRKVILDWCTDRENHTYINCWGRVQEKQYASWERLLWWKQNKDNDNNQESNWSCFSNSFSMVIDLTGAHQVEQVSKRQKAIVPSPFSLSCFCKSSFKGCEMRKWFPVVVSVENLLEI